MSSTQSQIILFGRVNSQVLWFTPLSVDLMFDNDVEARHRALRCEGVSSIGKEQVHLVCPETKATPGMSSASCSSVHLRGSQKTSEVNVVAFGRNKHHQGLAKTRQINGFRFFNEMR